MNPINALAIVAALAVAAPAAAEPNTIYADGGFAVSYSDLDLNSHAGQAELARRIDDATHRVCDMEFAWSLSERRACRARVADAISEAAPGPVRTALAAVEDRGGAS